MHTITGGCLCFYRCGYGGDEVDKIKIVIHALAIVVVSMIGIVIFFGVCIRTGAVECFNYIKGEICKSGKC